VPVGYWRKRWTVIFCPADEASPATDTCTALPAQRGAVQVRVSFPVVETLAPGVIFELLSNS